ncbi:PAS domain-containing protein [Gemmata sp. JC673]|uniref:protein-glutamate O-methyltransferase n=1 Tax=Gemmata algarum TaxID=2975278 RepID=A0ABU5F7V6_9BACT|nr:chemotaxis protein CheB [Gemmata algarum]MDY3562423.1 PAS domain-containing protein [Gemmata algarum]
MGTSDAPGTPPVRPPADDPPTREGWPRHVVAIGASAGGLEALEGFFDHTPIDTGMAFVVIQHLSPDYKSLMVELLSRHTRMRVLRAEHGMPLEPDSVYLIPPRNNLTIRGGRLQLTEQVAHSGVQLPIDLFFRSLASEYGDRAVGVILSGTGSDGARGVRAVKEAGGLVAVQDEAQARFDGMPRSAIATGLVDLVLPVEQLPAELVNQLELRAASPPPPPGRALETDDALLRQMFDLLRQHAGVDFSLYKPATVTRRVDRRMSANRVERFPDYVRLLEQSPPERDALHRELLIGVTQFFRDPAAFEVLQTRVVPELFAAAPAGEPVRVWAPACSTGEEAYSLAVLLREYCDANQLRCHVKIFATDVDREAVAFAAAGVYPEASAARVAPDRLARHFTAVSGGYQVSRAIREMVVFAYQNLVKDPPFTRMSLVVCRNLLIYLQPVLQRKALALLAYALRPGGFLFLGASENPGHLGHQFQVVDTRWKVYRATQSGRGSLTDILALSRAPSAGPLPARGPRLTGDDVLLDRVHQELVRALGQTCLVVDAGYRLLHSYGNAAEVLTVPPGRATLDLLRMVPAELASAIRVSVLRAAKEGQEASQPVTLGGADPRAALLRVRQLPPAPDQEALFLVLLERAGGPAGSPAGGGDADRFRYLEGELERTRENLQATIEELETSNEELQATNEELVAANEELQSTNEELQSVNEELQTVNAEYQQKIDELTQLTDDYENLLRVTDVGILFVDEGLRIRKFTPAVSQVLHVIPEDVGRPLEHLSGGVLGLNLAGRARAVLAGGAADAVEVPAPGNRHLRTRFLPYLVDGRLRGVVVYLLDITPERQRELRTVEILNSHPAHVAVLDGAGTIVMVNRAWEQFARANGDPDLTRTGVGANYLTACDCGGDPAAEAARDGIRGVLDRRLPHFYLEYPCHAPDRRRWFMMRVCPTGEPPSGAIVWHLDITERREAEERLAAGRPGPGEPTGAPE